MFRKPALWLSSAIFMITACSQATVSSDNYQVSIGMSDGTLYVTPMADDAVRVQYIPNGIKLPELENLIYTEPQDEHACSYIKTGKKVTVSAHGDGLRAIINTRTGQIIFKNSN